MTKAEIIQLFLQDMKQPAIQLALVSSFRKYADRRDELIRQYAAITHIPGEEFHTAIAMEMAEGLRG